MLFQHYGSISFLLFYFLSSANVHCDDQIIVKKFPCGEESSMQYCNKYDEMLADLASNIFRYNKDGDLVLSGNSSTGGWSDPHSVYFRRNFVANCTKSSDESQIPNFDFTICLGENRTCTNGFTICYEAQMTEANVHDDYVLKNHRTDIVCPDKYRGIHISTITEANGKTYFLVKVSIDKHVYKFSLPPKPPNRAGKYNPCFKIRMGSYEGCQQKCEKTLAASITNMRDEKLVFTGDPPVHFKDDWYYQDHRVNNFWLLFLDFMPMFVRHRDEHFYRTVIRYQGSTDCGLSIMLSGHGLFQCAFRYKTELMCIHSQLKTCSVSVKDIFQTQLTKEWGQLEGSSVRNEDGWTLSGSAGLAKGPAKLDFGFSYRHTYEYGEQHTLTENLNLQDLQRREVEKKIEVGNVGPNTPARIDWISLDCLGTVTYLALGDGRQIAEQQARNDIIDKDGSEGAEEKVRNSRK